MKISLITPTRNRPHLFRLCERWMDRQTVRWHEWIVSDHGETAVKLTQGQKHLHNPRAAKSGNPVMDGYLSFVQSMQALLANVTGDVILFVEDDDWYSPHYIETMTKALETNVLVGCNLSRFYNWSHRAWSIRNYPKDEGSAFYQMGIHRDAVTTTLGHLESLEGRILEGLRKGIRVAMFAESTHEKRMWDTLTPASNDIAPIGVGMKGLPGHMGISDRHRIVEPKPMPASWSYDDDLVKAKEWIGEDVDPYVDLIRAVGLSTPRRYRRF